MNFWFEIKRHLKRGGSLMHATLVLACAISMTCEAPAWAYTAYVSNEGANTVSVVDLDAGKTI
jgi:hypothetical protein